jgi:hypothetical protein
MLDFILFDLNLFLVFNLSELEKWESGEFISFDIISNKIEIFSDEGRLTRPLLYFEENLLDLNKKIFFEYINFKNYLSSNEHVTSNEIELESDIDSIDCFFNCKKKKVDPSRFNFQKATLDMKLEFYKQLDKFHFYHMYL